MRRFSWVSTLGALAVGGGALFGSVSGAAAQECESDADCSGGLICKSYEAEACARPAIDCPEGEECPEPAPCEPTVYKQCELPPCASDDDCPDGTVCHAYTYTECTDSTEPAPAVCPEGQECPQPDPPVCETPECKEAMAREATCEEVMGDSICVPRYTLPCTESADCGAGFTCDEVIIESCSAGGSAGAPTPGDGSDPVPPEPEPAPEPECMTERTGEFYCQVIATECADASDCESGWTCEENPERPVCGGAVPPAEGDGSSGSGDFAPPADEMPIDSDCGIDSSLPEKVCTPPYYYNGGGVGIARGGVLEAGAASSGADDSGGGEPPGDPQTAGAEGDGDSEESDGMEAEDSKSCAVAAPGSGGSSAFSLLGLLGLSALLRRRTRKA